MLCLPLSALGQHDLVDEVDDSRGRLFGVQLGKQVTNVLSQTARLLGDKTKHPERGAVKRKRQGEEVRGSRREEMTQTFIVVLVGKPSGLSAPK